MVFDLVLVPMSSMPLIRDMHRQTKQFAAADLATAKRMLRDAFPLGVDDTGSWMVEDLRPAKED